MSENRPGRLGLEQYVEGVRRGDRGVLARAITLVESQRPDDGELAKELLERLAQTRAPTLRLGITGVPGVGKSTFIESLGMGLVEQGTTVAVLAVDPTSKRSGGSILGDKTRMAELSRHPGAFVRPSPAGRTLGGVAGATRETVALCEAAGFDIVIVETVGVGQSEALVAEMVDVFVLLLLAGAGDELQGIKRGVMEVADVVAINKADGDNLPAAKRAAAQVRQALHLMSPKHGEWTVPVVTCSSLSGEGVDAVLDKGRALFNQLEASGALVAHRAQQDVDAMHRALGELLRARLRASRGEQLAALESQVRAGTISPMRAAAALVDP